MKIRNLSIAAATSLAANLPCAPLGGALSAKFGRRKMLVVTSIPMGAAWVLMGLAPNVATLFAGRILTSVFTALIDPSIGMITI